MHRSMLDLVLTVPFLTRLSALCRPAHAVWCVLPKLLDADEKLAIRCYGMPNLRLQVRLHPGRHVYLFAVCGLRTRDPDARQELYGNFGIVFGHFSRSS